MQPPRVYQRLPSDEPTIKGLITRGICDFDEKAIYINPKQGSKQKLITAIHEALHYILPKKNERWIEEQGVLIGEVVWKLGFRIKTNENIKRNTRTRPNRPNKKRQSKRKYRKRNISASRLVPILYLGLQSRKRLVWIFIRQVSTNIMGIRY